jgi:uncharacterized protein (TIGR02246 family)
MDDREAIRRVNDRFYQALEGLDLASMESVWLHESWVHCIHPGGEVILGWNAIRKSFEQVFANTSWMRVTPTAVRVAEFGNVAVVSCAENITLGDQEEVGLAVAQATNVFCKTPTGWKMTHHHASSAPVQVTHPFSGTVQ